MALASCLVPLSGYAAEENGNTSPRLVVGITVEGLSAEYLDMLKANFSPKGLGYLFDNAVAITDVDFGTPLDGAAANALIYTGASPAINGIASAEVYDVASRRPIPSLNASPSAADEAFSPARILCTTLTDELKIAREGESLVHSVAPDASMAITAAGHAANSAYWINNTSGWWTTSIYFQDRPSFLQYRNRLQPPVNKLDTLSWTPLKPVALYPGLSSIQKDYPFRVFFNHGDPLRLLKYKSAPVVNDEITEVATEYIRNLDLGSHEAPDMLSVAFTLQPYPYGAGAAEKMEIIDGYYRLDNNLGRLFSAIDDTAGLDNALIFVVGTPGEQHARREDGKWRLPSGDFSVRKATSLLNLYLINKFGNGDWIAGYHNGYFHLNPSAVSENSADIKAVRREAADFLRRMSGVAHAYPVDDIIDRRYHENADAMARNTRADATGDILVDIQPGWRVVDNSSAPDNDFSRRMASPFAPAFILWKGLAASTVENVVDARALAPTLASILRIRAPSGASLPPLRLSRPSNR